MGDRARRSHGVWSVRRRCRACADRARSRFPSSTRSGRRASRTTSSSRCTPPTAATRATGNDWTGPAGDAAVQARPVPLSDDGPPADRGLGRGAGVPRRAHPLPRPQDRARSRTAATGWRPLLEHFADTYRKMPQGSTRTRSWRSSATSTSARSTRTTSRSWSTSIGADHVLFGSDYPHPEGLAEPLQLPRPPAAEHAGRRRRGHHGRQPRPADARSGFGLTGLRPAGAGSRSPTGCSSRRRIWRCSRSRARVRPPRAACR